MITKVKEIKGPFSYSGNKWRIWKSHLKEIFREYKKIIEPFAGSAVALYNSKEGGIGIDIDPNIVCLHNSLKDPLILEKISLAYYRFFPEGRNKQGFIKLRDEFNLSWRITGTTEENVHLLHLLVQLGFNSLIRFSKSGFNTPYGRKEVDLERIRLHSELHSKKKMVFINGSYLDLPIEELDKETIIYFDPPYTASKFKYGGWNKENEIKLLEYIDRLNKMGVNFVLSNTFSHRGEVNPELQEWSKKYNVTHIKMSYNAWTAAVSNVKPEKETDEVIVTNIR